MKIITVRHVVHTTISLMVCLLGMMPLSLNAQIISAGSGSYTLQLPPPDAAGRNLPPAGVPRVSGAAAAKPIVTNDWWTGLLTFNDANLYNYPLSLKGTSTGLVVSYTFLGQGANDTRQPMGPEQPIVVGVSGLTGTYPTVSDHTDWTVTASWNNAGRNFNATIGMGMPFVYCTKGNTDVASVLVNTGTVTIQNEMLLITNSISSSNFAVYAPVGSSWVKSGNTYTSTLAGKNYYSVAMLPPGGSAAAAAEAYKQHAYVFPTNTAVSWNYNSATSNLQSTFTVTSEVKEGSGTTVLLGLLPHQWAHLGSGSPQPGSYSYTTSRGVMKMLASNSFIVENIFKGVLSALPLMAKYSTGFDPAALNSKIDLIKNTALDLWTDSYNEGLAMNKLIQVAKIADQMGNTAARDKLVNTVRERLESWFKATPGENAFVFYYNNNWKTLIGYPAGYSSDANINDHHFHYANFINAAVAVEQFQPGWAANWGPMVEMLIKDVANTDKSNDMFPFLRNFHPYAGHSFASGQLNGEPHGNNQESSSEAMNFNASLIHWGEITGNKSIRDLGIYLYTTEQTAIEEYWFDMSDRNFAPTYAHMMCARVWGNGYDRNTFWTGDIAAMYGIEMFPMTASHLYLGHNKTYASSLWTDMTAKTGVLTKTPNDNLWFETYWSFLAFTNPAEAVKLYDSYPNYKIKNGNTDAHTYHWLHAFNGMGTLDATITASHPISAVFNKGGDKTYVAHNYGATPIVVTYSDGFSMSVPARTLKTSKDNTASVSLSASQLKVPTGGSVDLTATVSGTGISKVEFYNGTVLIDTKTAAPFTTTAGSLSAKVHGFYAKVYIGSSVEISNVVSVVVGSTLPYQGKIVSIPSEVVEPGNYDYYEGGLGQNITYFDATSWNDAGSFRSPEYVDAGPTTGEGNTVGWIDEGEWLEYTVNITQAGTYDLTFRYASGVAGGGGPFHLEIDGNTVVNNITVGFTGSTWNTWATKTVSGVVLPAGKHVMRLVFDKAGFNIGKLSFTYKGTATPSFSLSANTASIQAFANSKRNIDITANVTWSAVSNQSWLNVSPASGFGNAAVVFTAQENPTTSTRIALVTFSSNGLSNQTVTVTQDAGGVPYLIMNQTELSFNATTNTAQKIDITSNVSWTASSSQPWLTLNSTSGTGIASITANVSDNSLTSSRTAVVSITGAGLSPKTVNVTQAGAAMAITLPINFELGGTYKFTDFDGGAGSVVANPSLSGINYSSKVGKIVRNAGATWAGSYLTLSNKIEMNALGIFSMKVLSPRAGVTVLFKLEGDVAPSEITATTTKANQWETLTWNFTGKPTNVYNKLVLMFDFGAVGNGTDNSTFYFDDIYQINSTSNLLSLSKYALNIEAAPGSKQTFDIQSNVSWSVSSSQSWLVPSPANGSGNSAITLTADQNTTTGSRTANVTVSSPGLVPQSLLVTQDIGVTSVFNNQNPSIRIYPNPAKEFLFIEGFVSKTAVQVYNVNGTLLLSNVLGSPVLNIGNLDNGVYFLKITDRKGVTIRKFLKLR